MKPSPLNKQVFFRLRLAKEAKQPNTKNNKRQPKSMKKHPKMKPWRP